MLRKSWIGGLALFVASLGGCGGGGGGATSRDISKPAATLDVEGPALGKKQVLTVRFSESMAAESIRAAGSIGSIAQTSWATEASPNDTLVLAPPASGWPAGTVSLILDGHDLAGNQMEPFSSVLLVPLEFSEFQAADLVLGQPDFMHGNGSTTSPQSFSYPAEMAPTTTGGLFIADPGNSRIVAYPSMPDTNYSPLGFVVGEPDSFSNSGDLTRDRVSSPNGVSVGDGKLLIVDSGNFRALIYNSIPHDFGALPDVVLGAPDFQSGTGGCTPNVLGSPNAGVITDDGKILIADLDNNRVLIWNRVPSTNGQAPDVVLGQRDGSHCLVNDGSSATSATLKSPTSVWSDGKKVVVADSGNNRVLIWHSFPTTNMQGADVVIGQKSFSLEHANDDDGNGSSDAGPTARTLSMPLSVSSNGVQLAVADRSNNRVLVWNSLPAQNFEPASAVLGHRLFTSAAANDRDDDGAPDAPEAYVLYQPAGVAFVGGSLLVSDGANNRILRYRSK